MCVRRVSELFAARLGCAMTTTLRQSFSPMQEAEWCCRSRIRYTPIFTRRGDMRPTSRHAARPQNALMPNWVHCRCLPRPEQLYRCERHGFPRPQGQTKADDADAPSFGPSRSLDFELELGILIGTGNSLRQSHHNGTVSEHIFGMVLVKRLERSDIQKWEYQTARPVPGEKLCHIEFRPGS